MNVFKNILKEVFILFHLDITKNIKYDRLTRKLLKKHLKKNQNCIDVGCHKGEILEIMLKYANQGKHFAFEPIPYLFEKLKTKYRNKAAIFPYALSDKQGESSFFLVKNAPAYSGIKKRRYDIKNPEFEKIKVKLQTLDECIPSSTKIDFIKIDVEGGEFGVIKGAKKLLQNNKPIILFECGKGGSDYYDTTPSEFYHFLKTIDFKIYLIKDYLKNKKWLDIDSFKDYFETNKEYYFVAAKKNVTNNE